MSKRPQAADVYYDGELMNTNRTGRRLRFQQIATRLQRKALRGRHRKAQPTAANQARVKANNESRTREGM